MLDKLGLYSSLLINFVVIIGWLLKLYLRLSHKNTVVKFFGDSMVSIYFPTREANRRHPMIASEDFHAANTLAEFLRKLGITVEFRHIPPGGDFHARRGSVIICGPKSSNIVRNMLETDPYYKVHECEDGVWRITEKATDTTVTSPLDKEPPANKDVAYVGKLKANPHDDSYVLVIAGLHAIGSLGAVHYLSNMSNIRRILRETRGARFSMVVASEFDPNTMEIHSSSLLMSTRQH